MSDWNFSRRCMEIFFEGASLIPQATNLTKESPVAVTRSPVKEFWFPRNA
jgi:hypothetical protein